MSERENQSFSPPWVSAADDPNQNVNFQPPPFQAEGFVSPPDTGISEGREKLELANELLEKSYHPILIFGTRASGKTSLLASLFHYLQTDPDSPAFIVQGEWIVPIESNYGQTVADAATRFLSHVVNNFHDGEAAPSTRDDFPFYIPVILRPNNGQPEVRLAFLESRGEWYHIDKKSQGLFPVLREEVSDVYKNYTSGISILLIAPFIIGEAYSDEAPSEQAITEMRDSDTALFGALQSYQMLRTNREFDKYLFILTKWDAHTRSIIDKEFITPPRGMVSYLISERFPKSWTLFQTMQSVEAQSMQYCSGVISCDSRLEVPENLKPIMNKFPQMLWRWLYANAAYGRELFLDHPKFKTAKKSSNGLLGLLRNLFS